MKLWFKKGVWVRKNVKKKIETLSYTDIKSIAILRHAALGDMVLTRNFIIEAKKLFPNATVTLCVISNYTLGIPEDLVDRVHVIHGTDQRDTPIRKRIIKIRELGYHDFIFDLAAGNRSFLTCLLTPALLKFGFPYRRIQAWMFYDVTFCRSDLNFEVIDMLNMLHVIGARTEYPHVYNMPGKAAQRERPYIIYFTGASAIDKCWPRDRFADLIQQMAIEYPDRDHLILDGLKDWESADSILSTMTTNENSSNIGSLRAGTIEYTASLMKGADLLVSNDTGIRHVAITCNTPTVGIFMFGGAYRYWPRYPIHDALFPTEKESIIDVTEVKDACVRLLQ